MVLGWAGDKCVLRRLFRRVPGRGLTRRELLRGPGFPVSTRRFVSLDAEPTRCYSDSQFTGRHFPGTQVQPVSRMIVMKSGDTRFPKHCIMIIAVGLSAQISRATAFVQDEPPWVPNRDQYTVEQLTFGPGNHLFGYIGHAGTIPWNDSGRYILGLRSDFQDHMPTLEEPAEILLLDTQDGYRARKIAETRGWNLQQGSMLYWNPEAPETQFFFNDRDPKTGEMFTVLFDISKSDNGQRVREFRFPGSSVGNSGVKQTGGEFLAINYGRLARLRLVTGIAGLKDWSESENAPDNDGVFKIAVATGERTLLVSYRQLRDAVNDVPDIENYALFINHTLWNRSGERISFYLRSNFRSKLPKVDIPFTINSDGTGLTRHPYLGGHPEWDEGDVMICADDRNQLRYDTVQKKIVGKIGDSSTFVDPGGDIAMSPAHTWFINGHKIKPQKQTFFTFYHLSQHRVIRTEGFPIGEFTSGELRIDPAPCWNRSGDQILFGAYDPKSDTRQLFLLRIKTP